MIKTVVAVVSLLPGLAFAVICKTIDAEGLVSYADVPAAECAQQVKLPDYSRYAPRLLPDTAAEAAPAEGVPRFTGYQSIRITQPEAGGSVRNNQGKVPVAIALEPELQAGHRVTLVVDDRPLSTTFDGLAIELSGVPRGSHRLRAAVSDEAGKRLIESSTVDFTMRQASRLEPQRQPDADGGPEPGEVQDDAAADSAAPQPPPPAVVDTQPASTPPPQ